MDTQPSSNRSLLRNLTADGRLDLTLGGLFERSAPYPPGTVPWSRVRGMLLGLAIGDALGNTTEGLLPADRRAVHGEIRNYLPNRHAENRPVGLPSDDSQLAFWTLEHLAEHGRLVPDELAQAFAARRIFGIGGSVQQFLAGLQAGRPWWQAAARSAGNGALMRIAPIAIAHLRTADPAFWSDAALCAAITHNDRGSIGTCTAFAGMLGELLARDRPPDPQWWVNSYVTVARDVEGNSCYRSRGGAILEYRGPIWRFVQEHVPSALKDSLSVREAGRLWYSGAFLLETVPAVLFILARYGEDPEEAIVRAVNDTKDNDTIAAIVGAAVGALHGEDALPRRWRDGLLGRTTADDDGRIFELLDRAEMRFGCEEHVSGPSGDERLTRTRSQAAGGPGPAARVGPAMLARAQGCLLGQLAGDALGGLVEFQTPEAIRRRYPKGVREMASGGTWDTLAGQPTDDSELALTLARTLVEHGRYDPDALRKAYVSWLESEPFDCGATIVAGLTGRPNVGSQANGALMRISPLGIFGANHDPAQVMQWARQDAAITHPHEVCRQANVLFAAAIAFAIRWGGSVGAVFSYVRTLAGDLDVEPALHEAITNAAESPPTDYVHQQGWVLIAFRNALWQLLHAPGMEAGVVDTVMRGGDTDTNAAICGALLGAVYGRDAVPKQWIDPLLDCRPEAGLSGVRRPRPEVFWPVDVLELAERLVAPPSGVRGK